jgi:hypothetical protein
MEHEGSQEPTIGADSEPAESGLHSTTLFNSPPF